jgi:hypothetical protein
MASIFLKLEGNTVKNRIWDFLIVYSEFDYSMREIAKYSRISYTAMKEIWKEFVRRKLVMHTRNVGKAKMYKLNLKNPQVKKFIDYYWAVIESHVEKELNIKEENYEKSLKYSPSVHSLAASAKNI